MLFPDISNYQPSIDWLALRKQVSIVAIKVSEGNGFVDPSFHSHKAGAETQNFEEIWYYHFARQDLGNTPQSEADFFHSVLGQIRPQDRVFLDYEVASTFSTPTWAHEWLVRLVGNYDNLGIYSYLAFVQEHLQDITLAVFPLWLAAYGPKPTCPSPWSTYLAWQFTDKGTIAGIPTPVDCNYYYGGHMSNIPAGWHDDGKTLTAPNGIAVKTGFRDHVLAHNWDTNNWPLQPEEAHNPLELSNTSLGGGTWQPFRWTVLEWDAKRGVQEMWTGQELLATRKLFDVSKDQVSTLTQQLATANAQITTLQQQLNTNAQAQEIDTLKGFLTQIEKIAGQSL